MPETSRPGGTAGPAVDRRGNEVIDPTKNVLQLVEAAMARQDDLRKALEKMTAMEARHLREMTELRARERVSDVQHLERVEEMRSAHAKELREAEADRINAIRAVDNQAVQQAAQVSATQATTLASQVALAAEAMRVQVAATASASATALANALEPITKAIEDLRRAQYEAQGKAVQVVDTRASHQDHASGANIVIGAAALVLTTIIIMVSIMAATGVFHK